MTWIFQGNPKRFDVDGYLSQYPELVYWRTPKYQATISLGDRVIIWRSGINAGAIAIGTVVEAPTPGNEVKHPDALGAELWRVDELDPDEMKTGIHLEEIRLTNEEKYLPRDALKEDVILAQAMIIKVPNGTVFSLNSEQTQAFERLWGGSALNSAIAQQGVSEGEKKLRSHFRRERSSRLRAEKLSQVHSLYGKYICALCNIDDTDAYPKHFGQRIFEVHHISPLAKAITPVRTTLGDLAVLCANCHRAVHATPEVDENFAALSSYFKKKK